MSALPDYPPEWDEVEPAKTIAPRYDLVTLRHLGGDTRTVVVEEATADGVLHVRWPNGAGVYAVHVFVRGELPTGLYRTPRARRPIGWDLVDPESAQILWRRMMKKED